MDHEILQNLYRYCKIKVKKKMKVKEKEHIKHAFEHDRHI